MPKRIQRKRAKGWRMPAGTVYVGRGTKWGNPWRIGQRAEPKPRPAITHDVEYCAPSGGRMILLDPPIELHQFPRPLTLSDVLIRYRTHIIDMVGVDTIITELRGKDLCCWCPLGQPCHADILLELANRGRGG